MQHALDGKRVAILVADGFEQVELTQPRKALEHAGALAEVVSPAEETVTGWQGTEWGDDVRVDVPLDRATADEYDALLLPGGVRSSECLRGNRRALELVRAFFDAGKPVAAMGHGPWMLVDAGVLPGRRLTSDESLRGDLARAGAEWLEAEVVVDRRLVSSRTPGALTAFIGTMIEQFREGGPIERRAA